MICIISLSAPTWAQNSSSVLEVALTDASRDPVAGAAITLTEEASGLQIEGSSDSGGRCVFLAVRAGTYTLSVKAQGFAQAVRRKVSLLLPSIITESITLVPGDPSSIDESDSKLERLALQEAQNGKAFSQNTLRTLPLALLDPLPTVVYQPGIQIKGGDEGASSVSGMRPSSNSITMDGISVSDPVNPGLGFSLIGTNPDTVDNLRIITSGAKAEYGGSAGGQVEISSARGGKTWSGSLFDYYRAHGLAANDYFLKLNDLSRPRLVQNIFGGLLSGPVRSNKTLLLANFEGFRKNQDIVENQTVLSSYALRGLFRWYTPGTEDIKTYDIIKNDPRKLGIDPGIKAILDQIPEPDNQDLGDDLNTGGYRFRSLTFDRREKVLIRLDHALNSNHRLFMRFNWNHSKATDVQGGTEARYLGGQYGINTGRVWGMALGADSSLGTRKVNEFRMAYLRLSNEYTNNGRTTSPMLLANSWTDLSSPASPRSFIAPAVEASDNLSWLNGRHVIKLGATFRRTGQESKNSDGIYPNVTFGQGFGNAVPSSIGPSGNNVIFAGDRATFANLYNDLLGRMESISQSYNSTLTSVLPAGTPRTRSYASQDYAAFIQTDWRVGPNLSVNLGIRYELSTVPHERNGQQMVLDKLSQVNSSANIDNFSFASGTSWYSRDVTNFAPRLGFAWNTGKFGLILRGGYGIYYDRILGATTNFIDKNSTAFNTRTASVYPNTSGKDVRLSDGIPLPAAPAAPILTPPSTRSTSIAIFDPKLRTPYVHQFNLNLQRQLFNNTIIEATYVGSRGKKLFENMDWNQTKTQGDFLTAFQQLQAFRSANIPTPVPASNTLVKIFGSTNNAIAAIGGSNLDLGKAGTAADILDRNYYARYAAAGVSNFYIRNFPQFSSFIVGTNGGSSWYNSAQVGIRRSTSTYQVSAHYTWAKAEDTMSADGGSYASLEDNFSALANRAPSDFERRKVLSGSAVFYFPWGKGRRFGESPSPLTEALIGGWEMGILVIRETGPRFSVTTGRETYFAGASSLADFNEENRTIGKKIGKVSNRNKESFWFSAGDIARFAFPAAGSYGTSGRNAFVGPDYKNIDISLIKNFRVLEGKSVQFRMECFNLWNRTNYGLPSGDFSDQDHFGQITTTVGNPRFIQMALKIMF